MQQHPLAHILRAIAEGRTILWNGQDQSAEGALRRIANGEAQLTIKPRTIRVGDYEFPEPLRANPAEGSPVYRVSLDAEGLVVSGEFFRGFTWCANAMRLGLLHATREAARQHALALLSLSAPTVSSKEP